jgi:hypothetical protein
LETEDLSWKQKTRGEEQTNCCESTHGDRSRQQEQHGHLLNRDGYFPCKADARPECGEMREIQPVFKCYEAEGFELTTKKIG